MRHVQPHGSNGVSLRVGGGKHRGRVADLKADFAAVLLDGVLSGHEASKLRGRLVFANSQAFSMPVFDRFEHFGRDLNRFRQIWTDVNRFWSLSQPCGRGGNINF